MTRLFADRVNVKAFIFDTLKKITKSLFRVFCSGKSHKVPEGVEYIEGQQKGGSSKMGKRRARTKKSRRRGAGGQQFFFRFSKIYSTQPLTYLMTVPLL